MAPLSRLRPLLCCLAAVAGPTAGRAADPKETVSVKVVAILASDKHNVVDKRLAGLAAEVQKKNPNLTGLRVAHIAKETLTLGVTKSIPLTDGTTVDVTANASRTEEGKITITIKPPKIDQITYNCVCERYFSMATQHFTKDKEQLFIAVSATPNPAPGKEQPKEPAKGK